MKNPEANTNLQKARQAYLQRRSDLQDLEKRATKYLAVAGSLGLALVLPIILVNGSDNFRSAIWNIDWTSFYAFYTSAWEWMRNGNTDMAIVSLFSVVYCVLVWHWLAELRGWVRIFSGKHLWTASFAYFFILISGLAYLGLKGRRSDLVFVFFALLIPTFFLLVSMGLWRVRKLLDDNPTDIDPPPAI